MSDVVDIVALALLTGWALLDLSQEFAMVNGSGPGGYIIRTAALVIFVSLLAVLLLKPSSSGTSSRIRAVWHILSLIMAATPVFIAWTLAISSSWELSKEQALLAVPAVIVAVRMSIVELRRGWPYRARFATMFSQIRLFNPWHMPGGRMAFHRGLAKTGAELRRLYESSAEGIMEPVAAREAILDWSARYSLAKWLDQRDPIGLRELEHRTALPDDVMNSLWSEAQRLGPRDPNFRLIMAPIGKSQQLRQS